VPHNVKHHYGKKTRKKTRQKSSVNKTDTFLSNVTLGHVFYYIEKRWRVFCIPWPYATKSHLVTRTRTRCWKPFFRSAFLADKNTPLFIPRACTRLMADYVTVSPIITPGANFSLLMPPPRAIQNWIAVDRRLKMVRVNGSRIAQTPLDLCTGPFTRWNIPWYIPWGGAWNQSEWNHVESGFSTKLESLRMERLRMERLRMERHRMERLRMESLIITFSPNWNQVEWKDSEWKDPETL
jgi:hypothetical protein